MRAEGSLVFPLKSNWLSFSQVDFDLVGKVTWQRLLKSLVSAKLLKEAIRTRKRAVFFICLF